MAIDEGLFQTENLKILQKRVIFFPFIFRFFLFRFWSFLFESPRLCVCWGINSSATDCV